MSQQQWQLPGWVIVIFFPMQREGTGELQATGSCHLLSAVYFGTTKVALLKADKKSL